MDCKADIAVQDETYPTYIGIDCDLHIDKNTYPDFYGRLIDCDLYIIVTLATACKSWNQGIRLTVFINGVEEENDVTSALVGSININHNKNIASTFSLSLGDAQYSPHTNSNIGLSKEVIITAYIDGHEKRLITGIIDDINMDYSPEVNIGINGMDYSKRLLDKRTTIVSVQDLASTGTVVLRSAIIKYLAEQAGITSVDIPEMDAVDIDNSFSDQTIWDMIQKEAIINQYWVRFNEEGVMELKLDEVKTSTGTYPTVDWNYGEDRFTWLGLRKGETDILNKVIILGATYEKRVPTIEDVGTILSYRKSWSAGTAQDDIFGTDIQGDFTMETVWAGQDYFALRYRTTVTWSEADFEFTDHNFTGNNVNLDYKGSGPAEIHFVWAIHRTVPGFAEPAQAGAILISIQGRQRDTYEIQYNRISASISDPTSIDNHGERSPLGEESIEFPLIETQEQCIAVGKKIIRDSYRGLAQPNFEVPFNPLLIPGQTIEITDKKIGFSEERWYVESVVHSIEAGEGLLKGRTQAGCVYYATT